MLLFCSYQANVLSQVHQARVHQAKKSREEPPMFNIELMKDASALTSIVMAGYVFMVIF